MYEVICCNEIFFSIKDLGVLHLLKYVSEGIRWFMIVSVSYLLLCPLAYPPLPEEKLTRDVLTFVILPLSLVTCNPFHHPPTSSANPPTTTVAAHFFFFFSPCPYLSSPATLFTPFQLHWPTLQDSLVAAHHFPYPQPLLWYGWKFGFWQFPPLLEFTQGWLRLRVCTLRTLVFSSE